VPKAIDSAAFAARAEPDRRELHVHAYRMLGSFEDAEDAEDAVQQTLLRRARSNVGASGRFTLSRGGRYLSYSQ
jgi:RNA polymerase sigma-70 factor (ECF subfamily)